MLCVRHMPEKWPLLNQSENEVNLQSAGEVRVESFSGVSVAWAVFAAAMINPSAAARAIKADRPCGIQKRAIAICLFDRS